MATDEAQLRHLMQASLDGNAAATHALLSALVPVLRRYYARRMASAADLEDLVQETLIAVHTRRASYDRTRAFGPWLFAVARYKMIDHFRRSRHDVALDDLGDLLGDGGFEDAVSARLDIDAALATLSPKQAATIRATKIEGLSIAEAAARDDISEADVKVSVHRGLKALAKRLRPD
ncbi:sigma-70 family RNA polymerase sigma factor [Sphingomonas sp. SUN039]|uniref:sigma-70 family RNA polymerase sigma factor n=1 Tax=Sphingomonas sp. SUN039 TaxID=2937787 RepID=UPI002164018D|nr:sigma-70 family RNA polymerase sigma factor [Sphingomonas sp. SUN039]